MRVVFTAGFVALGLTIGVLVDARLFATLVTGLFGGGVVAVWCCLLADYTVKALLLAWRFASGRWQDVRL